jgi:hypothetical protein
MNRLLKLTAIIEAVTGLALIAAPTVIVRLQLLAGGGRQNRRGGGNPGRLASDWREWVDNVAGSLGRKGSRSASR